MRIMDIVLGVLLVLLLNIGVCFLGSWLIASLVGINWIWQYGLALWILSIVLKGFEVKWNIKR